MFDPVNTYVTQMPSTGIVPLTLHGTVNDRFDLYTLQGGSIKDEVDNLPLTANPTTVPTQLHWGLNTVCAVPHVTPQLVPSTAPESATCIDVAFLP